MSRRAAARLAWSLWALTIVLMMLTVVFGLIYPLPEGSLFNAANLAVLILFAGSYSAVGALIASHRSNNPIGWVFCAVSLLITVAVLLNNYAEYAFVVQPGTLPWAKSAAWVENWIWLMAIGPVGLFLLLFPDGHLPSRGWRPVAWFLIVALAGWFVSQAFVPGLLVNTGLPSVRNPYGIEPLGGPLKVLGSVSRAVLLGSILASALALIVRFKRSRGDERQQLKWVAYAGALVMVVLIVQIGVDKMENNALADISNLVVAVSLCVVPVSSVIAILKYRLYDIDTLINRTLVYGTLTATLVALYFGGIVVLQRVYVVLAGHESTLAVVASTLAIAALFNPLRRRIQSFIDRRFYRRKYDARKTLEAFNTRLRDETDLEALSQSLLGVVRETMQPAHVSLWIRPDTLPKGERRA